MHCLDSEVRSGDWSLSGEDAELADDADSWTQGNPLRADVIGKSGQSNFRIRDRKSPTKGNGNVSWALDFTSARHFLAHSCKYLLTNGLQNGWFYLYYICILALLTNV